MQPKALAIGLFLFKGITMKFVKFNFRELFKQSVIEEVFQIKNRKLLTHRIYELNEDTSQIQWFVIELVYERKGVVFPVIVTFFKYAGCNQVKMKLKEFMSYSNKPLPKTTVDKIVNIFNLIGLDVY